VKPRQHGRRRRARLEREADLNITAFLNLMVVLLPFLLTTAVFARLAVIGVDVPTPHPGQEAVQPPPPPVPPYALTLRLEADGVRVRSGEVELPLVPRLADGGYDTGRLGEVLAGIKAEHPDHDTVDLYARPGTPYGELIGVMDAASLRPDGGTLFGAVRLGEARP
jgi:biopolymer transport protein ExbD